MSLPENLARLQAERGETNYRLAKEIDVSQTSIKNWKDGARRPHPRQIKKLANHFGVPVDELLESSDGQKKNAPPNVAALSGTAEQILGLDMCPVAILAQGKGKGNE